MVRLGGCAAIIAALLVALPARGETVNRFDGTWSGTALLNPPDTRCSDARVRMQIEAGKISGRVTWPAGSSDVSGEVAEDGVAKVKLTSLANGRSSSFVGQFTDKDFKAYDRGRTCSFDFALTR
jgi:hypothetical protein